MRGAAGAGSTGPEVSVVIPCHDSAPWLRHAVTSALDQRDVSVEVVVVDDASSDGGIRTVEGMDDRVRVLRQPERRGANAARNVGIGASHGSLIQFLDADDVLLPGKLAAQRDVLRSGEADIVYSDWQFLVHDHDHVVLGAVQRPGEQADVLTALLRGWWYATAAPLYTRDAVARIGPWDESLVVAQDRGYALAAALEGCHFGYLPILGSWYRRHLDESVTTKDPLRFLQGHLRVVQATEERLRNEGRLTEERRRAIAESYVHLARKLHPHSRAMWNELLDLAEALDPHHLDGQSRQYRMVRRVTGRAGAEWLAASKSAMRRRLSGRTGPGSVEQLRVDGAMDRMHPLRRVLLRALGPSSDGTRWRTGRADGRQGTVASHLPLLDEYSVPIEH